MKMHDQFGLNWSLLERLTLNAIDGAFIPEDQKEQLRAKVRAAETVTA